MKKYIPFFRATGLFSFCLIILFSCKKDDKDIVYSERAPSQNLFLSISGTGNLNRTQKVTLRSTAPGTTAVGLNLTRSATTDITAAVSVDTAKVITYNAANNTHFYLLPAGSYDLQSPANGLTVKAGNLFSSDSVKVTFKNLKGLRATNYLLPITITKASGNTSVIVSDSVKTVYLNIVLTDVVQPTVSLATLSGTTTSLTFPVGANGAASTTAVKVQLSPVSPNNITVATAVDNTLISQYGSGYTAFPDGSYSLSASSVAINAGLGTAAFNVNIPDLSKFDGTKAYLLPVTISKVSGDSYALTGNKTVYLKLTFNNLNNANNTGAMGTRILSQSGWSSNATSSADFSVYSFYGGTSNPASNAIDGNNSTNWIADYVSDNKSSITIDMKASRNIKTIAYNKAYDKVIPLFGSNTYPPIVNVYTSSDGTTWVSQGQYNPVADSGGSASAPVVNYINFFNAIPARYVRLEVMQFYTGFSEINVYE